MDKKRFLGRFEMTRPFFNAYLSHAVPKDLWPELNELEASKRFFGHLNQADPALRFSLKGFMTGLEVFLGLFVCKPRRFSKLFPKAQAKALKRLYSLRNRPTRPMVTLLKTIVCMSAYSQPKMLEKLGYLPDKKHSMEGCLE
jgi:hypothetical protein